MAVVEESYTRREEAGTTSHVAVIFGVTGIVGKELARKLTSEKTWKVYGIARTPEIKPIENTNYNFISCDLLNPSQTQKELSLLQDVTHFFWVTWASQFPLDSEECCEQNKAMLSNALNAILPVAKALKHVSLQTGMNHYVSLQGHLDKSIVRFYDEESPRVSTGFNFYYVLEDLLKEKLDNNNKVAWSVHRPGLIMGSSHKTLYNFMGCLCVYGTICKHLKLPFVFGGTRECWEETYIDGSDARLVAEQHIWAASNNKGEALNAINGMSFTWKEIWPMIGMKFGVDVPTDHMFSEELLFSTEMANKGAVWKEIVEKDGLIQTEINDLANWFFLDAMFRYPFKLLGSRDKADQLGFKTKYQILDSIMYWVDFMRDEKLIP